MNLYTIDVIGKVSWRWNNYRCLNCLYMNHIAKAHWDGQEAWDRITKERTAQPEMESIDLCLLSLLLCPQQLPEHLIHNRKARTYAKSFSKSTMVVSYANNYCVHSNLCLSNLDILFSLSFQSITKSFSQDVPLCCNLKDKWIRKWLCTYKAKHVVLPH